MGSPAASALQAKCPVRLHHGRPRVPLRQRPRRRGRRREKDKKRASRNPWGTGRTQTEDGGYLLSHLRSTIGVSGLNFSVRNGKRWNPAALGHLKWLMTDLAGQQEQGQIHIARRNRAQREQRSRGIRQAHLNHTPRRGKVSGN